MAQEAWPEGIGLASSLVMGLGWLPFGVGSWAIGRLADSTDLTFALGTLIYVPIISLVAAITYGVIAYRKKQQNLEI